MDRLKSLLKRLTPDHFVPSTAVFPDIETEAISNELRLSKRGAERGGQNLPAGTENNLDSVEQEIVARVSELRRKALNRYEEHLQAYESRLWVAQDSKAELKKIEGVARTDFHKSRREWETRLSNERSRVTIYHSALKRFQEKHNIWRPVYEPWSRMKSFGFVAIMVIFESVLNGQFFAKGNELGLVGGFSVAIIVSILNVGVSLISGYFSRYINHVSGVQTFFGFVSVLFFLAFAVGFNFAVAHFRDAANNLVWDQAAVEALATLKATPLALVSIESWLLIVIGIFICGVSLWKGWALDDPYPGYSRVYLGLENARNEYADRISMALDELQGLRDDAVEDLEIAQMELSSALKDAIQVLYSRHGLRENREVFLEHADQVVNLLLSIYREHNTDSRDTNPPNHFLKAYAFEKIKAPPLPKNGDRLSAEKNLKEINTITDETISAVFTHCQEAIDSLPSISDLQKAP